MSDLPKYKIVTGAQLTEGYLVIRDGRPQIREYKLVATDGDGKFIVLNPEWEILRKD